MNSIVVLISKYLFQLFQSYYMPYNVLGDSQQIISYHVLSLLIMRTSVSGMVLESAVRKGNGSEV